MRRYITHPAATASALLLTGVISLLSVLPGRSAAAAVPQAKAAANAADANYRISPEDILEISVVNRPEVSKIINIPPNGKVAYPYLGEINVIGMTLPDLTRRITKALSEQYNSPQVTITLRERQVRQVSVLGAVRAPGKRVMREGWRVLDAVADSGGLVVERPEWVTATLVQGDKVTRIDMAKLYASVDPQENTLLASGDVLIVQELPPAQTKIQVSGEVLRPGPVDAPRDGSITAVLNAAGGPNERAALSQASIKRGDKTIPVDLRGLQKDGTLPNGIRLEPGDTLVIPENQRAYAVIGAVGNPGTVVYPDDRTVTVMDAWTRASGMAAGAELKNAVIIRRPIETGKEPQQIKVDLEKMVKKGDMTMDVPLQPGDVLYVPASGNKRRIGVMDVINVLPAVGFLFQLAR